MLQAWHNQLARGQGPAHTHRSLACHAPTATARRHLPARRVLARCQPPDNTLIADPPKETSSGSRPQDGPAATGSQAGSATGPASDSTKPTTAPLPPRTPYQPSGIPETTWYCWPEGFIGQSFSLAGKMQPRASPLLDDVETLYQFTVRRREVCSYTEHTIDSAESASEMVEAVVGGAVDMGMFNASGSASFSMSRDFSSRAVSHALVASFQENELLEMVSPSLTDAAKKVLMTEGPDVFAARYGTHFVSGVGHRGAFIGSITVKLSDMQLAVAASASFTASYGACSGMAELKTSMSSKLSTSDVTFRWHKWGVEDDESLRVLEQYCASEDARFAGMRALAMHTADQAKGYPKLVKLRPYSTLPDYVEACGRYKHEPRPEVQLLELDQALSYLTKQYRKASYIQQVIDNDRRLSDVNTVGLASTQDSLAYQTKVLMRYMEEVFRTKVDTSLEPGSPPSMYQLCTFFKYTGNKLCVSDFAKQVDAGKAFVLGRKIKEKLDEVDRLNFELFKAMQRPIVSKDPGTDTRRSVHVAVASLASQDSAAFGRWWLDWQEQETFTKRGLYLVRLAWVDDKLQQVGATQQWSVSSLSFETLVAITMGKPPPGIDPKGLGLDVEMAFRDALNFMEQALADDGSTTGVAGAGNVFVMFVVGTNPVLFSQTQILPGAQGTFGKLFTMTQLPTFKYDPKRPEFARGSWGAIMYAKWNNTDWERKATEVYSGSTSQKLLPYEGQPAPAGKDPVDKWTNEQLGYDPKAPPKAIGMVLAEQHVVNKPDIFDEQGNTTASDDQVQVDFAPLEWLDRRFREMTPKPSP